MLQSSQLENMSWWEYVEFIYEEPSKDQTPLKEPTSQEDLDMRPYTSNTEMDNYYFFED